MDCAVGYGRRGGVATDAIDSSKFFDMIVWKEVFAMVGKMGSPRPCVEAPTQFCLLSVTILFFKVSRVRKCGKLCVESSKMQRQSCDGGMHASLACG